MSEVKNPFDTKYRGYAGAIYKQIKDLALGESVKLDLLGRESGVFRVTLHRLCKSEGVKYKTKSDANGDIWVKRASK